MSNFNFVRHILVPAIIGGSIGLAAAVLTDKANAQTPAPTPLEYCNALAHYAEAVAKDRDNGTPEYLAIDLASQHQAKDVRSDMVLVVQLVHGADATPGEAASAVYALCWEVYGESE